MSYAFVKQLLTDHFPMQDEIDGSVSCACGKYWERDAVDQWAEHVEQEYNRV